MRNLAALFFLLVIVFDTNAATYYIDRDRDRIFDHSNPNLTGTIAWFFKNKGSNNRFILTAPGTQSYAITNPLILPEGSTLEAASGKAWIRTLGRTPFMIRPGNSSQISNIILDGNYLAMQIINGNGVDNFELSNSVVRRTLNTYDTHPDFGIRDGIIRAHGVTLVNSTNIVIRDNIISNIGDNGSDVANNSGPTNNTGINASGLSLLDGDTILVTGNTISFTLSAGVDTTNSQDVTITHNTIDNTGRNNLYGEVFAADAITAYHHERFSPNQNLYYEVTDNTITNWYNHGIHLSGRWLNIRRNSVTSPGASTPGNAIFVGDFRTRVRCSGVVWIQNNHVKRSSNSQSDGIHAQHYNHSTYWPSANTGDVGNAVNVTDHRFNNLLPGEQSCPNGFADEHYL